MSGVAAYRRRTRRTIVGATTAVVIAGAIVLVANACAPMRIATWSAVPQAEALVGDSGEVTVYVREPNINVSPQCDLRLQMREDISVDELTDVLTRVDTTDTGERCAITEVRTVHPTSLHAEDWSGVSAQGWAVLAERMLRDRWISIFRAEDEDAEADWILDAPLLHGTTAEGVTGIREVIAGPPLEPVLGPTSWDVHWSPSDADPVPHSISVVSDVTPPVAVADALDDLVPLIDRITQDDTGGDGVADLDDTLYSVKVDLTTADGQTHAVVRLTVNDWSLDDMTAHEAEYLTASRAAGYAAEFLMALHESDLDPDSVTVVANDTLTWGDQK
ncbi:hypothetical protein OED01_02355 [Microbacterium sp. M28]|uniref:hypothetical protein n=1 Tax=Microbacterium sp. M28 TaxID=2962064 RepID=UPI0021F3E21F|nr:hypothetical protein [Microbacterium sp. M28]UYO97595.1 hypothetical protein OED01_02355 [Microbacterium sp. M28]